MNKKDFIVSLLPYQKENWRKLVKALHDHVDIYDHSTFDPNATGWDNICLGSVACKLGIVGVDNDIYYDVFQEVVEDGNTFGEDSTRMVFDVDSVFAEHLAQNNLNAESADGGRVADLLESFLELNTPNVGDATDLYITIHWMNSSRKDNFPSREAVRQYLDLNLGRELSVKKFTVTRKIPRVVYDEVTEKCTL